MTATQAIMGEILKILNQLIWNIVSLFGRQTASVSCSYRWQLLHESSCWQI